jgi:hypothetical protein
MYFLFIFQIALGTLTLDDSVELTLTTSQVSQTELDSTININGVMYTSICECMQPGLENEESVKCAPTNINLVQDKEGTGASLEDVQSKLENTEYSFVSVTDSSFRCVDGRITKPSLGALGGDLGEFALALLVYEDLSGKKLDEKSINLYLNEYLDCMEQTSFYWCNDDDATEYVQSEMGTEGIDFTNPRQDQQSDLLALLVEPDGVGDLHLKNMLKYPQKYAIRVETVSLLIKVFYEILWDTDNSNRDYLYLEILPGEHNETGFLEVRTNKDCLDEEIAPLIAPREGTKENLSLFIYDFDAVTSKRNQLSQFFSEKVARNQGGITKEKFSSRMNHHGLMFLDVTGNIIAQDLPFFTASFENDS